MISDEVQQLSRCTLLLDASFLALAGTAGMIADTVGHFAGVGPLAGTLGSPQSISGFEAHGLAALIGIFMFHAANGAGRQIMHLAAMAAHLLLGTANILFWTSFVQMDLLAVGVVTTALHAAFAGMNAISLSLLKRRGGGVQQEAQRP
jgi:hypothetical protein